MSLALSSVSFDYQDKNILFDISFELSTNEILGVIGPNGAGKSTIIKLLSKILSPSKGSVLLNNIDIKKLSRKDLAKKIAVLPQSYVMPEAFSVFELVMMGRTPHLGLWQQETIEDIQLVEDAMQQTGIWEMRERMAAELSGGERQRLLIARALVQEATYLLLDEPTNHLDIKHQLQSLRFLKEKLSSELGILVVIHDLNMAAQLCDRILLLHEGKVATIGTPKDVLTKENIKSYFETEAQILSNDGHPVIVPTL